MRIEGRRIAGNNEAKEEKWPLRRLKKKLFGESYEVWVANGRTWYNRHFGRQVDHFFVIYRLLFDVFSGNAFYSRAP